MMSRQDLVSHSPMARMARQMPLDQQEQRKMVSLVTDSVLHNLV